MNTPINLMVIDIYHGDIVQDFKLATQSGIKGVIHKATQGIGMQDHAYAERRKMALDAGLLWGAYHFATNDDSHTQLENFLTVANPDKNTLLALDFEPEPHGRTMTLRGATEFLTAAKEQLGRQLVIYTGSLMKELLKHPDPFINSHRLWLSEYGPRAIPPIGWAKPWLWQYSGDGIGPGPHKVPGVPGAGGALDLNSYDGTPEQLAAEWAS